MDLAVITTVSYASAAFINSLLLLLLLSSWRGRLQGGLLLVAVLLTIISTSAGAWHAYTGYLTLPSILAVDNLRQGAWALFILRLLQSRAAVANDPGRFLPWAMPLASSAFIAVSALLFWQAGQWLPETPAPLPGPLLVGAIFLIWLIEQLFRNSSAPDRWAIKHLCIGVGGVVVFDAILFIDALLFNQINPQTWAARGFVQAIATPLIAISATRNPSWEVKVFVSRGVVFFTGSLMVTGGYLMMVAAAGYFLKVFGGDWGDTLLATLLFTALLGLIVLLSSAQLRGLMKQFITRNFYRNKYEYRDEWLKLTKRLAATDIASPEEAALTAVCDLLGSPGGAVWSMDNNGHWRQTCHYEWPADESVLELDNELTEQLLREGNIIDLTRLATSDRGTGSWPAPLTQGKQPWLLMPLNSHDKLQAIFQISQSHSLPTQLDWEDIALVTAAGHQVASYLAFHRAIEALTQARQFEAYNRLSAFLIHDLKNVVAQLKLVVQNSQKHGDNPEFVADAFSTVDNAAGKMSAMLLQLKHRHVAAETAQPSLTDMGKLLEEVVAQTRVRKPSPILHRDQTMELLVRCNPDRMLNVLLHLVQNAQEATDSSGQINLTITAEREKCRLTIADSGCGMSAAFISNGLFRPFKTTKGNAGMGIGVYESKEYIEAIGGRIDVTSEVGTGTQFFITLPLADSA